ncbi:MAG TPA: 16S rRNA (guanine(527)-N(7))-methyltransferase RsmG [bacterium]|nr:16S rRNA (guanine(527)-N(7))-methyltransferase RsmG [bacterium]
MSYLYTWSYIRERYPKLEMYLEELLKARKIFNLSGARNRDEFIKLIEESLAPLLIIKDWGDKNILDVGSGAGFPGIPLAIAEEDANFYLIDLSQKRCAFLNLVKSKLCLNNVDVFCGDIKDLKNNPQFIEAFDMVLSGAVSDMDYLKPMVFPLLKRGGSIVVFGKEGQGHFIKPGLVLLKEEKSL